MATLKLPVVLAPSAKPPWALLLAPVLGPVATLLVARTLDFGADGARAVLLLPVVLGVKAWSPTAVSRQPVVSLVRAPVPSMVLVAHAAPARCGRPPITTTPSSAAHA